MVNGVEYQRRFLTKSEGEESRPGAKLPSGRAAFIPSADWMWEPACPGAALSGCSTPDFCFEPFENRTNLWQILFSRRAQKVIPRVTFHLFVQ